VNLDRLVPAERCRSMIKGATLMPTDSWLRWRASDTLRFAGNRAGVCDLGLRPDVRGHRPARDAEMAQHAQLRIETGQPVYFCDPHSPWQRGTNENTNGLLRQYFPKGTDLSRHSAEDLAAVAATLNSRPRKPLGWRTPAEVLNEFLATAA
jgi:hypothetical protein